MASEYTENYNLDLYVGSDKPNLRDQYNSAMRKIDDAMKTVSDSNTDNSNLLAQLNRDFNGVKDSADAAVAAAAKAQTDAEGAKTAAEEAGEEATAATQAATAAQEKATEVEGKLSGYAEKNHASTSTDYGVGSATLFGHLKITDTPTISDAAASGVAVSGYAAANMQTTITGLDTRVKALEQGGSGGGGGGGDDYAPTKHSSTSTTYGLGNATEYGHVKLTDAYNANAATAASGTAASGKALNDAYTQLNRDIESVSDRLTTLSTAFNARPVSCGSNVSATGVSTNNSTYYTHNGVVVVKIDIQVNSSFVTTGAQTKIGSVQTTYAPTARIAAPLMLESGNETVRAFAGVNADGSLTVNAYGSVSGAVRIFGEVVYLANVSTV